MANILNEYKQAVEDARRRLDKAIKRTGRISDAYKESVELDYLIEAYINEEEKQLEQKRIAQL